METGFFLWGGGGAILLALTWTFITLFNKQAKATTIGEFS